MTETKRICGAIRESLPQPIPDPVDFARDFLRLERSALSKSFDPSITPWNCEPIRRATVCPYTRIVDYCKPVQSGGSVAGEAVLVWWIKFARGFLQYNWSNDKRARERWDSRVKQVLEDCGPVAAKLSALALHEATNGEVDFGNVFFRMQGAFVSDNLDSDTVNLQLNEEVHSWQPGHLMKAHNRTTAVWNYKVFDVSNAGKVGDQFHQSCCAGTLQWWEVKCPGCGLYHRMQTRWEENRPDLGGLRYDADGARRPGGYYDYNKIKDTVHYQFPCGYKMQDDIMLRRQCSDSGRYSDPDNKEADGTHRSYSYDAVTVHFIDWMQLIKDKHNALRARKNGDLAQWIKYVQERECKHYDPNDVPLGGSISLTLTAKKSREGLPDADKIRLFALDRQQGKASEGEFPHWWLLIRDFAFRPEETESLLVYESKVDTDEEVIAILTGHNVKMWQGCADSGDDTTHVYLFCLKYGINAIKGADKVFYSHGGTLRVFSPERPLHQMMNRPPKYPYRRVVQNGVVRVIPDYREPMFWLYSKAGIRERLHWLRTYTKFGTPGDVSQSYREHMEAEERVVTKNARTNEETVVYKQLRDRNDQYVNECYIAKMVDMAGRIKEPDKKDEKK